MGFINTIHGQLSNTTWLFFLALGLWGLYRGFRGQGMDSSYMGAVVIGQFLFIAQSLLGAVIWFGGLNVALDRPSIHLLYGAFSLVFIPFIYLAVLRGDTSNRGQWVMAFSTLFMFGITLRLITTGI
jgi:hypothetical protein